jgi:GSH-dependent disulfide-bond oxidoreductase
VIRFYFNMGPNPMKVALLLEELGLAYEPVPIDARKGQQFTPEYLAVNPNAKCPAIDDDGAVVFDSNAILLYLADKHGRFLPSSTSDATRGDLLSWMMFVASGIGPYSGQANHFRRHAPEPKDYALNRYDFEAERHWKILEERLETRRYLMGDDYTILDMSVWGWARIMPYFMGSETIWAQYPNVKRLVDEISARPAAAIVERLGEAYQFKTDFDEEALRHLFPQLERLKAAGAR